MSQDRSVFQHGGAPVPDEAFLQKARLAESRVAEVAAAIVALGADDEAIRGGLEKRLSQRHEQLRERPLLSSTQTLEALDRALGVARAGGAHSLVATGEKSLKIQSPTALLFRNGAQGPHLLTDLGGPIARGERKPVALVEDTWTPGTTSWWLEVTVKDQKGDSYRAQFTWELPKSLSR